MRKHNTQQSTKPPVFIFTKIFSLTSNSGDGRFLRGRSPETLS